MAHTPADFGLLDNFNRANTGPPAGPGWANVGHWGDPVGYVTSSNVMAASGGGWRADRWATAYARSGAVAIGFTVTAVGSGDIYYFLLTDPSLMNGYTLRLSGSSWTLGRFTGSLTSLATYTQAMSAGDGVCLIADDDGTVHAWHKPAAGSWTQKASVSDSTYTGTFYPAISAANSSARWDDMFGGAAVASAQSLEPGFISGQSAVHNPTLVKAAAQAVTPNAIASGVSVPQPTLVKATPKVLAPNAVASTGQVFSPSLASVSLTLAPAFIASAAVAYQPTLARTAAQALAPSAVGSSAQVFAPTLANVSVPTLHPDAIGSSAVVYGPAFSRTAHKSLAPSAISAASQVFSPSVAKAAHAVLGPDLVVSTAVVYAPLLRSEGETRGHRGSAGASTRATPGTPGSGTRGAGGTAGASTRVLVGTAGSGSRGTTGTPGSGSDR